MEIYGTEEYCKIHQATQAILAASVNQGSIIIGSGLFMGFDINAINVFVFS